MSHSLASELARRLARNAEAVCRRYLSNGSRQGRYWLVGDARNAPGRSLFVRLAGAETGKGAAGKWTDAATGEHGDLLDIIRESAGLIELPQVLEEARRFLNLPSPQHNGPDQGPPRIQVKATSSGSARRLFAMSQPIPGTLAEAYLLERGIINLDDLDGLRFHPRCFYRSSDSTTVPWPALIAAVTDLNGSITGAHRTWLDRSGAGKALFDSPRRAMGDLSGKGVRFGVAADVMVAGEGIETVLSVRSLLPRMPMIAALSSAQLAALTFPPTLRRLYVLRDNDDAGRKAANALAERATASGIDAIVVAPQLGDFNDDLRRLGPEASGHAIRVQLSPPDVSRFLTASN
jgi:Toprim domain